MINNTSTAEIDMTQVSFDDWHLNDTLGTVILYFSLPKSYADAFGLLTQATTDSIVGTELYLEYPVIIDYPTDVDENAKLRYENDLSLIDRIDFSAVDILAGITVYDADAECYTDIDWRNISLSDNDIKQLLTSAGIIMAMRLAPASDRED